MRNRDNEEPTPGHSRDLTDSTEMVEPGPRVTRGFRADGDSAHGKTRQVKVKTAKRETRQALKIRKAAELLA